MACALWLSLPVLAWSQEEQQAQAGDKGQGKQEPPKIRSSHFVFVEGSLPYIPTSNTIATKLPLVLRLTPFNVGIVTAPLFKEQGGRVLSDALENVSNISIQPGFGVHDFFIIRGFDSLSSGLILTDGAAEPEATFYQLYNVEAVEVLKGPSGFLYGSNPLAGAVNLVRKQPLPNTSTSFSGTAGSFQNYQGTFDFNFANPSGEYSFRLNSLLRDADSYRDDKDNRTSAVNPAFRWKMSDNSSLNLNFEFVDADFTPDSGVPIFNNEVPGILLTGNYQAPFDTSQQDIFRFQADFEHTVNDSIMVRDKFYFRDLDWLSNGTLFNGVFPKFDPAAFQSNLVVNRSLILLDDRQRFTGNQFEGIFSFSTGSVDHNLLAGLEVQQLSDDFTLDVARLTDIDLFNPVELASGPLTFIPGQSFAGDSRNLIAAPYVTDQLRFSNKFQILLGARLDAVDFEDSANSVSRDDKKVSPMVGAVFSPTGNLSLYANFSRSFAPPSARVQNGKRVPEKGTQFEGGIRTRLLDDKAQFTAAVYNLERDNIAIPDDNGFTQQVGDQRSRGLELEFTSEPTPGLHIVTSYAYNDAELTNFTEQIFDFSGFPPRLATVDRSGNTPAFAPDHLVNFWIGKSFRNGLGVAGGGRYVSDQFIGEDNLFVIDDLLTLNAAVSYSLKDLRLQLNVKNLTDRDSFNRGFGVNSVIPADPITVFLGLSYRY